MMREINLMFLIKSPRALSERRFVSDPSVYKPLPIVRFQIKYAKIQYKHLKIKIGIIVRKLSNFFCNLQKSAGLLEKG